MCTHNTLFDTPSFNVLIASQNPVNTKLSENFALIECEHVNTVLILEHIFTTQINVVATKVCGCYLVSFSCSPISTD